MPWRIAVLFVLFFPFSLPPGVFASDSVMVPLFPAETFHRDTGSPSGEVRTFSVLATEGVFVKGPNSLEVEVRSIPSSYITVSITGVYLLGVTITEPLSAALIASDRATVHGVYTGYTNDVGISVNGVAAAVQGNMFFAADVPLNSGSNALTSTVTTFEGIRNTDRVEITATGEKPPLSLWSNYASGVAPFTVNFRPEAEGIVSMEYRYDFDGDGTTDIAVSTDETVSFGYVVPGTYRAKVTAIDGAGQEFSAEKLFFSMDRAAVDALLSSRWNALSSSLRSQDVEGGLVNFLPVQRDKYRAIFTQLSSQLPDIFSSLPPPELIAVEGNVAQYRVKREQSWEGEMRTITYYLWMVRDNEGVWRIDSF